MIAQSDLLTGVIRDPGRAASLDMAGWDLLVRQARRADLLARVAVLLDEGGLLAQVPEQPQIHLRGAKRLAEAHANAVRWEVGRIAQALSRLGVPVVLLKGAAYVMAGLPAARGRLFNDIDIMVPRGALQDSERALFAYGWVTTHTDPYDQRYYRQWMHELPPLQHGRRKTVLDVHHNILPLSSRLKPDAAKLLHDSQQLDDDNELYVLTPADMILHSATHLFHDGELEHGLRDLVDLDSLLRQFSRSDGFWDQLTARARELTLERPLYYALRYARNILDTPVPDDVFGKARTGRPVAGLRNVMDWLFGRALAVDHPSCDRAFTGVARWLLYVRSHHLRMPPHLLVPHLVRKAARKHQQTES